MRSATSEVRGSQESAQFKFVVVYLECLKSKALRMVWFLMISFPCDRAGKGGGCSQILTHFISDFKFNVNTGRVEKLQVMWRHAIWLCTTSRLKNYWNGIVVPASSKETGYIGWLFAGKFTVFVWELFWDFRSASFLVVFCFNLFMLRFGLPTLWTWIFQHFV